MKNTKSKLLGLMFVAGAFIFSMTSCADSQNDQTALTGDQTITGEILDMSCYMDHGAKGDSHKKCAQGCLEKGLPAGILGENGQVYLLLEDHDAADQYDSAIKHAAETIEISGKVVNNNGVQALIVEKVNAEG